MFAVPARPVVRNAIADRYRPLAPDQQKLAGILADRIRAAREGYLERVNEKALLASFQGKGGHESGAVEQLGKFLDAAANIYDYSRDPNLKVAMDKVASELVSIQRPAELPACRDELIGLLTYYRVTGDEDALTASKRIGDLLVNGFHKLASGQRQPARALVEPLVYLYRYTGDARYLDIAERMATRVPQSVQSSRPLQERLDALIGLVELYRTTGDNSYYAPVASAWATLRNDSFFLFVTTRSVHAGELPQIADACTTASWIELTLDLLRLTGQSQYGEELERIIYNQLFAAQDLKNGNIFSELPLNGSKKPASPLDPCVPSESIGISLIPSAVWGRYGNGIAVILYSAGRATFRLRRRGTVQLYSEAAYPESGDILLHVEPDHNIQFPLRLRVPEWTSNFKVDIGESHLTGKPGDFLSITREWKRGDTVKITMNLTVHTITGPVSPAGEIAIQRGPQILALDKTLNPAISDVKTVAPLSTDPTRLDLRPVESRFPASWTGNQAYTLKGEYNGRLQQLLMVPFADAISYRVWMRKPGTPPRAMDH